MRSVTDIPPAQLRALRGVFMDIDDTLTTGGRLTAAAYGALEQLKDTGLIVVPITGRPAGWCDHIARMWPVDAVVGENGAFYFRYDRAAHKLEKRFAADGAQRESDRRHLDEIAKQVLAAFPGTAIASDQRYREADLAIDYCEDVPPLAIDVAQRIAELLESHGLSAKISSIHVNGWYGRHDKLSMTRTLLRERFDADLALERAAFAFVGDSPNDAPMFGYFPLSVAVANIRRFTGQLPHAPAYVTRGEAGAGFVEFTRLVLDARTAQ